MSRSSPFCFEDCQYSQHDLLVKVPMPWLEILVPYKIRTEENKVVAYVLCGQTYNNNKSNQFHLSNFVKDTYSREIL